MGVIVTLFGGNFDCFSCKTHMFLSSLMVPLFSRNRRLEGVQGIASFSVREPQHLAWLV